MAYLTSFDSRQLRNVLGTFTTGVTIVTTRDANGVPHGVTANSFSSVSLEPPLVLWSQALTSRSLPAFRDSDHFAVNILAEDQVAFSQHFARQQEDKFANMEYSDGLGGVPVLRGTVAHFECVKVATYPAGDHIIYLGRVERVSHSGRRPLAFAQGRYMVPYAHGLGPLALKAGGAPIADVEAVRVATESLPAIHEQLGRPKMSLAVWSNQGPTAIRWERSADSPTEPLRSGLVMSVTQTATGLAFAAFLPNDVTSAFVDEDLRLTRVADEDEMVQRREFETAVTQARMSGFAGWSEESIPTYSAPIFDHRGDMILAISATAKRVDPVALLDAVKTLSSQISDLTGD